MPEIINQTRVNEKLREFDEQMDGAISAATTIMRVKSDAEKLGNDLQSTAQKGQNMLADLMIIHGDWSSLRGDVNKTLAETNVARDQIIEELEAVQQRLDTLVDDAVLQLYEKNKDSLKDHYQYAEESKISAEKALDAKELCHIQATKLEQLLASVRNEYEGDFSSKYKALFEGVGKHAESIARENQQTMDTFRQDIATKMVGFQNRLQEDIDRKLTDFLAKQNILVQNFGQQVDGLQRSLTAQKVELEQVKTKISDVEKKVDDSKEWFSQSLTRQDAEIATLRARGNEVSKLKNRLERTLEGLQNTSLIGSKFKGI